MQCRHCGRDALWGTLFCPHCGARLPTWFVGWTLYITLLSVICAVVLIWLAEFFSARHRKPNSDEWPYLPKPMQAVTAFFAERLPNAAEIRLEPRGNYNLQIYLPKARLESLPYPDRDELLKGATKVWCENIPQAAFVPFVQIRDLQTEDELATARCPLGR